MKGRLLVPVHRIGPTRRDELAQVVGDARTIGASLQEGALGARVPARVFIVVPAPPGGFAYGAGADVLFLDAAPRQIEVCETAATAPGRHPYTIFVNGQRTTAADATAETYYLVGARHFVIAYDTATRDALARGLGLARARCGP